MPKRSFKKQSKRLSVAIELYKQYFLAMKMEGLQMQDITENTAPKSYTCAECGRSVIKIYIPASCMHLVYNAPAQPFWRTSQPQESIVTDDGKTVYCNLYGHDDPKTADGMGFTAHTCLIASTREQELVIAIADFLSDWVEEEEGEEWTRNIPFDASIRFVESYGVKFHEPCDSLVVNAIRHYMDIVNPWVRESVPDILQEMCNFTEDESKKYFGLWSQGKS